MLTSEGQVSIRKADWADHPEGQNVRGFSTISKRVVPASASVMCLPVTDAAYILPHFSNFIANP
jgi:hypothetical protein